MTKLQWDQVGERTFVNGIDRGVLYLSNGQGVPWNGLTGLVEDLSEEKTEPRYADGYKFLDDPSFGDYTARLAAITYPDEFMAYDGEKALGNGLFANEQVGQRFGLSFRTMLGNDAAGANAGYIIHLVYNATAIPSSRAYSSLSNNIDLTDFQWDISAIPVNVPGFRPTAHFMINSTQMSPALLADLESRLYGTSVAQAYLPTMTEIMALLVTYQQLTITDNGDGTWTATEGSNWITMLDSITFQIDNANVVWLDENTYQITST